MRIPRLYIGIFSGVFLALAAVLAVKATEIVAKTETAFAQTAAQMETSMWAPWSVRAVAAANAAKKSAPSEAPGDKLAAGKKPVPAKAAPPEAQPFDAELSALAVELKRRREALDSRERALDERAATIAAAEKRVAEESARLSALRKEEDAKDRQRLESLVKLYEAMKPKEAAAIFEKLEMSVLLKVMLHMKEAKAAPILAAMTPDRARQVTVALAGRKPAAPSGAPKR